MGRFINNENSIFQKWIKRTAEEKAELVFSGRILKVTLGTISSSEASQTFSVPSAKGCVLLRFAVATGDNQIITHSAHFSVITFNSSTAQLSVTRTGTGLYAGQTAVAWFIKP